MRPGADAVTCSAVGSGINARRYSGAGPGHTTALFRCAIVALLFLGLAYGALAADRRPSGIRSET
jgi:hypothetical protein